MRSLRYDCDADAVLALVEPAGPACHTGERTCFYRRSATAAPWPCTRRCPCSADPCRAGARPARGQLHGRAAARRGRDHRRQGGGRGGRGRSRRAGRVGPACARGGGRPAVSPRRAARGARAELRRRFRRARARMDQRPAADGPRDSISATVAEPGRGSRAGTRLQPDPAAPHLHRRLRNARLGIPEAAWTRSRPSCWSRPSRASVRALLVPRLSAARDSALRERRAAPTSRARRRELGRQPIPSPRSPTTCRTTGLRRWRTTAVRRRRCRDVWLRLGANGGAAAGAEPRRCRHAGHGADGLRRADRVRSPAPPGDHHGQRVRRRRTATSSRRTRARPG